MSVEQDLAQFSETETGEAPMLIKIAAEPTYADPNAATTWSSGVTTSVKAAVNLKTLIGKGSGESLQIA